MLTSILTNVPHAGPYCGDGAAWWPVFPVLWFLLVVAVLITIARGGWWRHRFDSGRSAEARLAERFAAGEIDENEYRTRLAVLKDQR